MEKQSLDSLKINVENGLQYCNELSRLIREHKLPSWLIVGLIRWIGNSALSVAQVPSHLSNATKPLS